MTKFLHSMIRVRDPEATVAFFELVGLKEVRRFESDQGRVVRTSAEGQVDGAIIGAFYAASLPQLGWKAISGDSGLYARENETLRIQIREPASRRPVTVSFELIVKLASTRLPE